MGQHTRFLKNKELFLKQNELYEKLDLYENGKIYLDEMEIRQLNFEIDEIDKQNDTEYSDLFRTGKRNKNGSYTDDVIFSKDQCFEFINNPDNLVYFKYTIFDTDVQEKINRKKAIENLNSFWEKYPDGVIYFG